MTKSLIFDFDGVIGNTFEVYAEFFAKSRYISLENAKTKLLEHSLKFGNGGFLYQIAQKLYFNNLNEFLKDKSNLIFTDRLLEIESMQFPKAILSRSFSQICRSLLGEKQYIFEHIVGTDTVSNKVEGLKIICDTTEFSQDNCLFFTDTVGDILELQQVLRIEQIYAVAWGYNSLELLKEHLPEEQIIKQSFTEVSDLLEV